MVQKCKNCGMPIVKFPIKGQLEKTLEQNIKERTINWINLFKIDLMSVIWVIVIIGLLVGYKLDMKKCDDVIKRPCEFCEKSNCCKVDWERINSAKVIEDSLIDIKSINNFDVDNKIK